MGIPLAMLVGRALTSSLYGVQPLDAVTYLLAVVGVAVVALGRECGARRPRRKCRSHESASRRMKAHA